VSGFSRTNVEGDTSWREASVRSPGFLTVVVLSLATDQLLHVLDVYPPWGQPMNETGLNALALSYRVVYTLLGGFITARLAPRGPMRHVTILAAIGLVAGTAGAIVAITQDLGPSWYPIALAVTAYPCTWFGGRLGVRTPA